MGRTQNMPRFVLGKVFFGYLHLWTSVCNQGGFALVTHDGSFFCKLRSDINTPESRAGCCISQGQVFWVLCAVYY